MLFICKCLVYNKYLFGICFVLGINECIKNIIVNLIGLVFFFIIFITL